MGITNRIAVSAGSEHTMCIYKGVYRDVLFSHIDALLNPALVSAQLHPQLPLPGAVGLAPIPSDRHSPPLEDAPLVMSSVGDKPQGTVECLVQECPSFLQKGILELFPGAKLKSDRLCVITLSEKTENDMTSWSMEVEEEREKLLEHVSVHVYVYMYYVSVCACMIIILSVYVCVCVCK